MYTGQIFYKLAAAVCSLLASCSGSGGPKFSDVKSTGALTPHNGKGMVIVYRTEGLAGRPMKPFVWVNNAELPGQLVRGGFYSCEAAPGPLKVEFSWHDHYATAGENAVTAVTTGIAGLAIDNLAGHKRHPLDVPIRANEISYVLMDGHNLSNVAKEDAEEELEKCQWLNPTKN